MTLSSYTTRWLRDHGLVTDGAGRWKPDPGCHFAAKRLYGAFTHLGLSGDPKMLVGVLSLKEDDAGGERIAAAARGLLNEQPFQSFLETTWRPLGGLVWLISWEKRKWGNPDGISGTRMCPYKIDLYEFMDTQKKEG